LSNIIVQSGHLSLAWLGIEVCIIITSSVSGRVKVLRVGASAMSRTRDHTYWHLLHRQRATKLHLSITTLNISIPSYGDTYVHDSQRPLHAAVCVCGVVSAFVLWPTGLCANTPGWVGYLGVCGMYHPRTCPLVNQQLHLNIWCLCAAQAEHLHSMAFQNYAQLAQLQLECAIRVASPPTGGLLLWLEVTSSWHAACLMR
jgi:hypothetical protein